MRISKFWAELKQNNEISYEKYNNNKSVRSRYKEQKNAEALLRELGVC